MDTTSLFYVVLRNEPRAPRMPGQRATAWATPPAQAAIINTYLLFQLYKAQEQEKLTYGERNQKYLLIERWVFNGREH